MAAHQEVSVSVDYAFYLYKMVHSNFVLLGLTFVDFGAALDKFPQTWAQDINNQAMPQKRMSLFTY